MPDDSSPLDSDRLQEQLPEGWVLRAVDVQQFRSVAVAIGALMDHEVDLIWTAPDPAVYNSATVRSLLLSAVRESVPVFG